MAKILIIDDDPDVRAVMTIFLKKQQHEVETAITKEDALTKIEQAQPSIILLDVLLSGSDGREICREIKKSEATKDITIIMFSAHPSAAEKIDSYGADDFIAKPLNSELLLQKIENHLCKKHKKSPEIIPDFKKD